MMKKLNFDNFLVTTISWNQNSCVWSGDMLILYLKKKKNTVQGVANIRQSFGIGKI